MTKNNTEATKVNTKVVCCAGLLSFAGNCSQNGQSQKEPEPWSSKRMNVASALAPPQEPGHPIPSRDRHSPLPTAPPAPRPDRFGSSGFRLPWLQAKLVEGPLHLWPQTTCTGSTAEELEREGARSNCGSLQKVILLKNALCWLATKHPHIVVGIYFPVGHTSKRSRLPLSQMNGLTPVGATVLSTPVHSTGRESSGISKTTPFELLKTIPHRCLLRFQPRYPKP